MGTLIQDVRYGFRMLIRSLYFTAVAVVSLAVGIGLTATTFSLMDWLCLRPLPVTRPGQLFRVFASTDQNPYGSFSYPDYVELRDRSRAFSGLMAIDHRGAALKGSEGSEGLVADVVSRNYFTVLGVKATLGRFFSAEDDAASLAEPVVVISHGLWHRRFGGDDDIVGKTILLTGRNVTVIGVTPKGFVGTRNVVRCEVWYPIETWAQQERPGEMESRERRDFELWGRLPPGTTVTEAQAEVDTVVRQLAAAYPSTNKVQRGLVVSEARFRLKGKGALLLLAMLIVGLVLLISCANVSSLLVARSELRRREMAIRFAVGGGRARLFRQLLTESLLLSLLGAGVSILLTKLVIAALPALLPPGVASMLDVRLDHRVVGFTMVVSLLVTLTFGLVPALRASKPNLTPLLKGEYIQNGKGRRRFSGLNAMVVGQLALSMVLLATAGLLMKSFLQCLSTDLGYFKKNILLASLSGSGNNVEQVRFYRQQLVERVQTLPGVKHASVAQHVPLSESGGHAAKRVFLPGDESSAQEQGQAIKFNVVGQDYFRTMGVRLLQGREFNELDDQSRPKVVMVSETTAQSLWPNRNPLGQLIRVDKPQGQAWEVTGVVEDCKHFNVEEEPEPHLYFPFGQMFWWDMTLLVETSVDAGEMVKLVRHEMQALNKDATLSSMTTMKELIRDRLSERRSLTELMGTFSLIGLILATAGLYGVVAYAVNRRRHEIGIRMALGARRGDVLKMILRQGLVLALCGLGIGLPIALAVAHVLRSLFYGVSPTHPTTFAGASLVLVGVVLAASYIPARRAAKVDPMVALRYE
ncbi:MAG: ABC transporter permease [Phycisphaerae bacterium]